MFLSSDSKKLNVLKRVNNSGSHSKVWKLSVDTEITPTFNMSTFFQFRKKVDSQTN